MITKVRVANFYSIGKEIELNFVKGGFKKENEEAYFSYKNDKQISLINGFFGANASGKSNVLGAIVQIIRSIYNVYSPQNISPQEVTNQSLWRKNAHKNFINKPTKLGIDFLFGNNLYTYDLEIIDENTIQKETLCIKDISKKAGKPRVIFTRIGSDITFGQEAKEYENYISKIQIEKYQTVISHLINIGATILSDFKNNKDSFFLKIDGLDLVMPTPFAIAMRAKTISLLPKEQKEETLEITKDILSCFDDSIKNVKINTDNDNISVKVSHKDFSRDIDIMNEFAGTRELFCYAYDIIKILRKGGMVVYDETNRYYHPDVEVALLSLFKNAAFNEKNAQIFFASHNHETFDLLELDQVHIVERTNMGTAVYKLSEIEDLRKRDNIKKKYRLGMLGGTPDLVTFDYKLKQLL